MYLKKQGSVMIAIKARSVDVTKEPAEVYRKEIGVLESRGFKTVDMKELSPFDKDHAMILAKKV
jgi:fibrillarin-like pre-rRNA processing protein